MEHISTEERGGKVEGMRRALEQQSRNLDAALGDRGIAVSDTLHDLLKARNEAPISI